MKHHKHKKREPATTQEVADGVHDAQGNLMNGEVLSQLQDHLARWSPKNSEEIALWNTAHNLLLIGSIALKTIDLLHHKGVDLEEMLSEMHEQLKELYLRNSIDRKAFMEIEIRLKDALIRAKNKVDTPRGQGLIEQVIHTVDSKLEAA